jgi:hypothetical protein
VTFLVNMLLLGTLHQHLVFSAKSGGVQWPEIQKWPTERRRDQEDLTPLGYQTASSGYDPNNATRRTRVGARALQSAPKATRNVPNVEVENDEKWGQARSDGNDEVMERDDIDEWKRLVSWRLFSIRKDASPDWTWHV